MSNMPFCHNYTHPTIALILRELKVRPMTSLELAPRLRLSLTVTRTALDWMHKQKLIRIAAWVLTSTRIRTRAWALSEGKPDAVKPLNKRNARVKYLREQQRAINKEYFEGNSA